METVVAGCALLTLFSSGVYWIIIKPLHDSIIDLQSLIREIRNDIKEEQEKRQNVEIRLSVAEDSLKNAHHRLNKLEDEK